MQFKTNGLHHTMSTVMVFQTDEYARFKTITGNRQLNDAKIKRIISEIESGVDLLQYYPIQVVEKDNRLDIVDGQHRFYICRKLKKQVYYIVLKREISLPDIAKVNSNVEKWKGADFINCYTQLDNENYRQLQVIMDKYPVPMTTAISLLQSGVVNDGGGTKNDFERGSFVIKKYDLTMQVLNYCSQFDYERKFNRQFIKAVLKIIESNKVKMEDVIAKVAEYPDDLVAQHEWKDYLTNLENIVNKGKKNRVVIY